jgi:hypothetical protein
MTNKTIGLLSLFGMLGLSLYPHQLLAQTSAAATKNNPISYEDDRIRVAIQDCNRKLQELVCQATLTSKSSDRSISLSPKNIKLVDFEGNEYYPSSLKLANRTSDNNPIETELVENVPFKATFIFNKIPNSLSRVALLQIPMGASMNAIAKFRNLNIIDPTQQASKQQPTVTLQQNKPLNSTVATKPATIDPEVSKDRSLICPDSTKIMYRATSKSYLMYICGAKNPTHYVGLAKDGSQGITLRLRYFDRSRFSADNGETNYTIAANKLIIRKDNKVVYQEPLQVLQSLQDSTIADDPMPSAPRKRSVTTADNEPTNPKSKQKKAAVLPTTGNIQTSTKPKLKKTTAPIENTPNVTKPKSKKSQPLNTSIDRQKSMTSKPDRGL